MLTQSIFSISNKYQAQQNMWGIYCPEVQVSSPSQMQNEQSCQIFPRMQEIPIHHQITKFVVIDIVVVELS